MAVKRSMPNIPMLDTVNVLPGELVRGRPPAPRGIDELDRGIVQVGERSAAASRITGTTNPPGTDTAMPRWTRDRCHRVRPSVRALTSGSSTRVCAAA